AAGGGVLALLATLAAIGHATHVPPWRAWSEVAERPAFAFAAGSPWVTEGRPLPVATTLRFTEAHRVTAAAAGVFRVRDHDGGRAAVHEWRLAAGDGLTLRPGDELLVPAGARVRFEAGKRVPGAAPSGVAWADPPARHGGLAVAASAALALTLVLGAAGLVRRPARAGVAGALAAPALVVAAVLGAGAWGVYAAWGVPELGLGAPRALPLLTLPAQ